MNRIKKYIKNNKYFKLCIKNSTYLVIPGWGTNNQPTNVPTDLRLAMMNITNFVLGFVAIIATLMVIYGGVLYLTSLGNEEAADNAKRTIAHAITGLFIVGLAYAAVIVITSVILV
ncbi:pilin [Patescibacteria group bacterium]|nr:pilin [Patescibacteria group bacterium]